MARRSESDAAREATDWLILVEDDPDDPAVRVRFAAWLGADPANARAWAETARAYDLIGLAALDKGTDIRPFTAGTIADEILARRRHGLFRQYPVRWRATAMVMGVVVACGALLILAPGVALRWQADYATGTAQQRTVRLADGTTIQLGADSAIAVDYDGPKHVVRLLEGRAFFEVEHDAKHPFTVLAHGIRTTDQGTSFEVSLGADDTDIAVAQGAVRVDYRAASPARTTLAEPGQWVRVTRAGQIDRGGEPVAQIAAWRRGQLIASNRPVAEVVDQIRPYFAGLIVLADTGFARSRVTGVYDLHDPTRALQALAAARPGAVVHRIGPWLLIISGR